jgi:hypothetical protein
MQDKYGQWLNKWRFTCYEGHVYYIERDGNQWLMHHANIQPSKTFATFDDAYNELCYTVYVYHFETQHVIERGVKKQVARLFDKAKRVVYARLANYYNTGRAAHIYTLIYADNSRITVKVIGTSGKSALIDMTLYGREVLADAWRYQELCYRGTWGPGCIITVFQPAARCPAGLEPFSFAGDTRTP